VMAAAPRAISASSRLRMFSHPLAADTFSTELANRHVTAITKNANLMQQLRCYIAVTAFPERL
jgi:hypothetical protein